MFFSLEKVCPTRNFSLSLNNTSRNVRFYLNSSEFKSSFISPIFDYKLLKKRADEMREIIRLRDFEDQADIDRVLKLHNQQINFRKELEIIRTRRNKISQKLKDIHNEKDELIAEGRGLKQQDHQLEKELSKVEIELSEQTNKLPNWIHPDCPRLGDDPKLLKLVGDRPRFTFEPKTHLEMCEKYDWAHFPHLVGSSKFYFGKRELALLEAALLNWALINVSRKYDFVPHSCPDLMNYKYLEGCGFQPRSKSTQVYSISNSDLCLVGTQEIPLASIYYDTILDEDILPIKMLGYGHCFRHEVAHNSENRGLYRVHQFTKLEMFVICKPQESEQYHQHLLEIEIDLLTQLGLHFQVLDMPTDDLGASAYRKFDIEAYMPYKHGYGEVTSASNCLDYQSRRLGIRYREKRGDQSVKHVHTLNATAMAIPRILIAILENFQQEDGSVKIPEPLIPFMGGEARIIPRIQV